MTATSILPVRSNSSASTGCVSVRLISRPGCRSASVASAAGTSDPLAEAKPASRTRPAFNPTWAESSAPAASMRPMISAARSASSSSGGREPDPAADALQQLRAGLGLEPCEVVGDRRLRVVQLLRRRGDRPVARDGVDHAQPVDVQHASTLSMSQHESWHWTYEPMGRKLEGMTATQIRPAARLSSLVAGIRTVVDRHADWSETAQLVADQLQRHLPGPDVLTAEQRLGSPDDVRRAHTLHVEPDGSFSIVALVWRPGQITRIHDHVTWCVFGVIQGVEHEELFDADLNLVGRSENHAGDVSGFAPPGDIHRVRNTGDADRDLHPRLRHRHHPHRLQRPPLLRLRGSDHVTRLRALLLRLTRRLRHR